MDYCLPRASDLPDLEIRLEGVATAANPIGSKGAGQAGAIASPPAVMSALLNALAPLGVATYRHAGDSGAGVAGDPGRAALIAGRAGALRPGSSQSVGDESG